ncbi:hypothetical protein [Serratia fonticola]
MSDNKDKKPASETIIKANSETNQVAENNNSTGDSARRAELSCLSTLASHAEKTNSLEVTRPTVTNCPDGGHDLGVVGEAKEVKELVSILTGKSYEYLNFLDRSVKNGKLKVRIDVKNGKTISGDIIDKHTADSNRSPDCQVNLLVCTNPDVKITPEASKRLNKQQEQFKEIGTLIDIALPGGLEKIKVMNNFLTEGTRSEEE